MVGVSCHSGLFDHGFAICAILSDRCYPDALVHQLRGLSKFLCLYPGIYVTKLVSWVQSWWRQTLICLCNFCPYAALFSDWPNTIPYQNNNNQNGGICAGGKPVLHGNKGSKYPSHTSTVMEAVKTHHHKTKALVHIISDSRGAGLQQIITNKAEINPSSDHLEFQVTVRRGARLETLAKIAFTHKKNFDIQVMLGGISLTSKQGKVVSYSHSEENIQEIKDCINVFFTKLQRRLLICTIPPASVIASNE